MALLAGCSAWAAEPPVAPEQMDAVTLVLGVERAASLTSASCKIASTAVSAKVDAAVLGWRQRHAELVQGARTLLQAVRRPMLAEVGDPAQLARFDSMFDGWLQNVALNLMWSWASKAGISPEERCLGLAADLSGPRMDLTRNDRYRLLLDHSAATGSPGGVGPPVTAVPQ